MNILRSIAIFSSVMLAFSCQKSQTENTLKNYIEVESEFVLTPELIACAGGMPQGWLGDAQHPASVFYLPLDSSYDFKYWETENLVGDGLNYSAYVEKELQREPVFNGKLGRFLNPVEIGEHWGIVTFKTPGKIHICDPIRIKTPVKPTELAPENIQITENGLTPSFDWQDGVIEENVIYFQVISDESGNLISGTYTYDLNWSFYDLSNVVLNIHDVTPAPVLDSASTYTFTLMGVSDDNWVNLMGEKTFQTP